MFGELLGEYSGWSTSALDTELRRLELAARELDARRLAVRAAAELHQVPGVDGHRSTKAYLRATTNQPSHIGHAEVQRARLCRDFPQIGEELMSGRMGLGQVDELARCRRNRRARVSLSDEHVDVLLGHAVELPVDDFSIVIDRWLAWADADGAEQDEASAVEARDAHVVADANGLLVQISGGTRLDAEEYRSIVKHFIELELRADIAARRDEHGEQAEQHPLPRTAAQRRHDAHLAMARAGYAAVAGRSGRMPEPVVNVLCDERTAGEFLAAVTTTLANGEVLDLDALTRRQVDSVLAELASDPQALLTRRCETVSGRQIAPRQLLQLLLDAHVRRVVLDSRGTVIDLGQRSRVFTGAARIALELGQRVCSHPGCDVDADCSQADHMRSHSDGGPTDQANGSLACGSHNRFKYRSRWRTRRADNGRIYSIRADGTLVLAVGQPPPTFEHDELAERVRAGSEFLERRRAQLQQEVG